MFKLDCAHSQGNTHCRIQGKSEWSVHIQAAGMVVHVGLGLCELHLVHALTRVPVEEGLAPEHGRELLAHTLEHLLDGGAVADEGGGQLQALGGDVAHRGLDVVGDPLHKVGRLRHRQGAVLLRAAGGQRGEAHHEEVQAREGDQVHGQLAQVRVELAGEAQGAGDARHDGGDQMGAHAAASAATQGVGDLEACSQEPGGGISSRMGTRLVFMLGHVAHWQLLALLHCGGAAEPPA
ncbi:uncharacterized protein HaLaN_21931 [Haematococcus lacustris]|uniref:Uncharacterized protein n=1 Tax=Haematococcus lacustris TaxID=44745 RepID=A0A699ZZC4_HAELA|nr:uncharacterized protein HaLaN_21931 [Haematococcus lacustris]